jgi:hypothetical protein
MGKKVLEASLGGTETDPFAAARKINGANRDATPVLPIGDIGYGTPVFGDSGAKYAESFDAVPPPAPKGDDGLGSPSPQESHPADRSGMQRTNAAQAAPVQRQLTPDELMAKFRSQMGDMAVQHEAQMGARASVGVRDSAGGKIPDWLVSEMKKNDTDM